MKTRLEAAKPWLWLGAIVLAGVLLIALVRGTTEPDAAGAAQAPATTADAVPASSPPQPAAAAAATDTPPWMAAAPAGAQGPNAAARTGQAAGQPAPDAATVAQAVVQVREQAARNERNAEGRPARDGGETSAKDRRSAGRIPRPCRSRRRPDGRVRTAIASATGPPAHSRCTASGRADGCSLRE